MPLFKKSISEKLNLDLINFADKEKENLAKKTLYLRKDVEKDQKSLMVVGLATGVSTILVVGSLLAHVTNTIPLDLAKSMAQMAIVTSAGAFAATPLMNLYDKMKDGLCKISGEKLKSVNDYEYDYQKLSIFKERIAGKMETPIRQANRYITAEDVKLEGRDYLYNSFATGVVGTMLAAGLTNGMTNVLPVSSVETIMTAGLYSLPLYAISPLLTLVDKCKENYSKITSSLKTNAALANEIDNGLTNVVFAAPIMEAKKLDINVANMPTIDYQLPAKKPEVPMNQDGLMDKSDYLNLVSDVRKSYAALLPAPTTKLVSLHDDNYFIEAQLENEINLAIENSNIKVNTPTANIIEVPYVKDNLKKPLFIDAFVKPEKEDKPVHVSVVESDELSKKDLLKFVTKIKETYKPLPEPTTRQIPKEVFIFEEPELIDMPVSGISAKQASNSELNITIPKELEGLKASKVDDVLPILEIQDNGFKVKEGDHIKQFFKDQILKQQAINNPKPENLVANKQDRVKSRMSV
jgi:hypothetical protein